MRQRKTTIGHSIRRPVISPFLDRSVHHGESHELTRPRYGDYWGRVSGAAIFRSPPFVKLLASRCQRSAPKINQFAPELATERERWGDGHPTGQTLTHHATHAQ